MKKQVAVIFGSPNAEHDISVASAASAIEHFPHDLYDLIPIFISKEGRWFTGDYSLEMLQTNKLEGHHELLLQFNPERPGFVFKETNAVLPIDAAFLMLHGRMGEGGEIQGLLNIARIPYAGCEVLSSALCMDKAYTHMIAELNDIPMADYRLLLKGEAYDISDIEYPVIVKPSREGSSFGVTLAKDEAALHAALEFAFSFDSRVLIEEYIKGTECGMGILKTKKDYIVSDVDQVNVAGEVFDFQEKYHPHATETLPVSTFPESVRKQIQAYGERVFELLDCKTFARIDFFVTEDHKIFFNEINTIPGFTANSRYPKMMDRQGVNYTSLIAKMVEDVL
ncbi:D-alanine--D-alanine ligase family protein [Erysipelothrix anatis]|uniref:D-alanine--D-alanine ligase family protein n=1 Tax=Erysipelothrix anatis TaxID=2683713 RepID=UPI00135CD3E7|nr:D-alanine--D-alanine ligase family protein [Erysipelothrix anatis]